MATINNISMSQKLFDDVKAGNGMGDRFVLAEIAQCLPWINEGLMKQKHLTGHLLVRAISTFDINHVFLGKPAGEIVRMDWPHALPTFPPSQALAKDSIYIRDLLTAIDHYFDKNFDDCVRNLITSVENFFHAEGLKGKRAFLFFRRRGFKSVLKNNLAGSSIAHEVVRKNMMFIYRIRNKIVHHDFRVRNSNGWGCVKGIGTVTYLYRLLGDEQLNRYMRSLQTQFILLRDFYGDSGYTLESAKRRSETPPDPSRILKSPKDLDRFVFEGLRFSDNEKGLFLRGK